MGKHQLRKTNVVTGRQFVGQQSETLIFEDVTKKGRPKGGELGRERQREERQRERKGTLEGGTVSSLQPEPPAGSSPPPSPLDVTVDDLQAVKVLHGTKQP